RTESTTSDMQVLWVGFCDFRLNSTSMDLFETRFIQGDIRVAETIKDVTDPETEVWKYSKGNPSSAYYDNNIIIYRWSDIQLMKAEALKRKQSRDGAGATAILAELRAKRFTGTPPSLGVDVSDMDAVELAILEERAIEFMAEGKRWFDVVRTGRVDQLVNPLLINKITDPNNYFWPISWVEMQRNPNLTQNPYYQSTGE